MPNISQIQVEDQIYQIKDAVARTDISTLQDSLGNLAFKDNASGDYTPAGTINGITGTATPSKVTLRVFNGTPTAPSWSASVDSTTETLSFSFNAGSISTKTQSVVTGITDIEITGGSFKGTPGKVTVS